MFNYVQLYIYLQYQSVNKSNIINNLIINKLLFLYLIFVKSMSYIYMFTCKL